LIGVTQFFRDPEAFETLEREVIPQILDRVPPAREIRLWVAGCATGEEAYSLAMLFHEALAARNRPINLKLLATDVHPLSLDFASTGIYGDDQLAHVTPNRLEKFITRRSSGYQISTELRQLIVFARHNVLKDAPVHEDDFISLPQHADLPAAAGAAHGAVAVSLRPVLGGSCSWVRARARVRCPTSSRRSTTTGRSTASGATSRCSRTSGCRSAAARPARADPIDLRGPAARIR
jgi:hypothetical protein